MALESFLEQIGAPSLTGDCHNTPQRNAENVYEWDRFFLAFEELRIFYSSPFLLIIKNSILVLYVSILVYGWVIIGSNLSQRKHFL